VSRARRVGRGGAVGLRHPSLDDPLSAWKPVVTPIAGLLDLEAPMHTDVVIF
jgi:hypothetical protein